jgi:hypothetical protein
LIDGPDLMGPRIRGMHHMAQHGEAARAAIRPVKEQVEDDLIERAGVVGVDIGEKITSGKNAGKALAAEEQAAADEEA